MLQEEMLEHLRQIYENRMPFNKLLGISITDLNPKNTQVRLEMREDLIGNFVRGILHGGVISSLLDLTGGLIASVDLLIHTDNNNHEELSRRMARIGTIDLRVDYLRAGEGKYFIASGSILRRGNKVAVVRTELINDRDLFIAAGTGTYLVG